MTRLRLIFFFSMVALGSALAVACDNGGGNETEPIRLVFPISTATDIGFVEVTRDVPGGTDPKRTLELLVAGPTASEESEHGALDPFPEGTVVRSVEIAAGVATADFSAEILDFGGGSANVIAITGSIERTLLAQPGVSEVVILVEGEPDAIQP